MDSEVGPVLYPAEVGQDTLKWEALPGTASSPGVPHHSTPVLNDVRWPAEERNRTTKGACSLQILLHATGDLSIIDSERNNKRQEAAIKVLMKAIAR